MAVSLARSGGRQASSYCEGGVEYPFTRKLARIARRWSAQCRQHLQSENRQSPEDLGETRKFRRLILRRFTRDIREDQRAGVAAFGLGRDAFLDQSLGSGCLF